MRKSPRLILHVGRTDSGTTTLGHLESRDLSVIIRYCPPVRYFIGFVRDEHLFSERRMTVVAIAKLITGLAN